MKPIPRYEYIDDREEQIQQAVDIFRRWLDNSVVPWEDLPQPADESADDNNTNS